MRPRAQAYGFAAGSALASAASWRASWLAYEAPAHSLPEVFWGSGCLVLALFGVTCAVIAVASAVEAK